MQAATWTAVVVLPTPPFWFAIAYTVPIRATTLAGGPADKGALRCHPGASREALRRRRHLPEDVQRPALGRGVRIDGADVGRLEPEDRRRDGAGLRLGRLDEPLPRHQHPAGQKQGRGVLA